MEQKSLESNYCGSDGRNQFRLYVASIGVYTEDQRGESRRVSLLLPTYPDPELRQF